VPKKTNATRKRPALITIAVVLTLLVLCCVVTVVWVARQGATTTTTKTTTPAAASTNSREVTLAVAYSPEKEALFAAAVRAFNDKKPRLANGKAVKVVATAVEPQKMVEVAPSNLYQAISPDSTLWLAEIDRDYATAQGKDVTLVGESVRYMVSPVVIAMWQDVAASLGYPGKELGWRDLLRAATERPGFTWSHPSTTSASGLLATLAVFYAGAGTTRDLTKELATAKATTDYVSRLEKTVKHYGEGELAVIQQVERQGKGYLDAFVVQEQMVLRYNLRQSQKLVAIYPSEGTLWADHPLALLEHPARTDDERLAFSLFKDYLLAPDTQMLILKEGYRPTDLTMALNQAASPLKAANGVDPAKPYTTLQIPSPAVVAVVKNAWQYTKRRTNIILVADTSGSMQGTKLRDAQGALKTFVAQIENDQERVGLITFATSVNETVPLTLLAQGRARLNQSVDGLSANGNTALVDGVDLAVTKLQALNDKERINAIVVMTDGKENASRTSVQTLVDKLNRGKASTPIVVFCIAYGPDADMAKLESISGATGGFTRRGDPETIKSLYKTLSTYF
jgi:Ca-activated chloride channel family protein